MNRAAALHNLVDRVVQVIRRDDKLLWGALSRVVGLRRLGLAAPIEDGANVERVLSAAPLHPTKLQWLISIAKEQLAMDAASEALFDERELASAILCNIDQYVSEPRQFTQGELLVAMRALNAADPKLWDRIRKSFGLGKDPEIDDEMKQDAHLMGKVFKTLPYLTEEEKEQHFSQLFEFANTFAWSNEDKRHFG